MTGPKWFQAFALMAYLAFAPAVGGQNPDDKPLPLWVGKTSNYLEFRELGYRTIPTGEGERRLAVDPLHAKELAKARFEAVRVDPRELQRAMLETSRGEFEARAKQFHAGRGTLAFFLEAALRLLNSELALARSPAAKLAILERHWAEMRWAERLMHARYDAGRVSIRDHAWTKICLLDAELWLVKARNGRVLPLPAPGPALNDERTPFEIKELAKAKFEAAQADPKKLARAKRDTASLNYWANWLEFVAGRGALALLLKSTLLLLDADLGLAADAADRTIAYARHLDRVQFIETVIKERFDYGRVGLQDLAQATYYRLEAELWLTRAKGIKEAGGRYRRRVLHAYGPNLELSDCDFQDIAKANFETAQTNPDQLAKAKLQAARTEAETRLSDFVAGRGTLSFDRNALVRWVESELALCTSPAEKVAALERHCRRVKLVEKLTQERFNRDLNSIQDYLSTKYYRLEAEWWLYQARAGKTGQPGGPSFTLAPSPSSPP